MTYEVRPLTAALGAEIHGFDFRKPLQQDEIDRMLHHFHTYGVLIFRDQSLTPEQQIAACAQFGEIELHPQKVLPWKHRELTYVANILPGTDKVFEHCGPPFELWHSDLCYLPLPAKMSFLYAERVPVAAGETLFACMHRAFHALPEKIRRMITGREAVFGSGYSLMARCQARGYDLRISENDMHPDAIHPVVRTHPVTGRQSIFVNWTHTDCIKDMPKDESDDLLAFIYDHCRKPEFVYTHTYRQGDLVVWDNAATLHSNTAEKLSDVRIMRRVMIKGSKPFYEHPFPQ